MVTRIEGDWVIDENNNRASIAWHGSEAAAIKSLATLVNCSRCSDCFGCSDCSDCSGCSRCSGCAAQKSEIFIPFIENIHQQVYEAASQPNALCMNDWHKCGTTHCRGGWVVTLAGKEGAELEKKTSTLFAAQQIYKASGYLISPCRFFDSEAKAMQDMKRLADLGSAATNAHKTTASAV